ncbi:hypothetical protein JHK82_025017 [Glycine max]|uniref:Uncharacterized protein n=2 Tax=Glycine subgen. Soja TaxID=1462606 RepID=A0A0R0I7Y0_SOYBN|nr:hypothetical protein JHK85_025634 [Glycine max]KAG5012876.1 hypothetical protein JHK86_025137 [Glycine max]KAG5133829.1 hypothetical protein JHK82_025017 [Glycine max]RZB91899.1 putative protein ORF91 [Glycine soja]
MGEQPNPWNILQPQVAKSRHRGAKPSHPCEILGKIRNLCTPPLPLGRLTPHRNYLPETIPRLVGPGTRKSPKPIPGNSEASYGLSVQVQVVRIFTNMSISPSLSPRQCPNHYAFHADVIVTVAVHRGFGHRIPCHLVTNFLDLPALGRCQPPYMVLRLCGDMCFCLLHPSSPIKGSTRIFTFCPSTTPFGRILGLDSPSVDEPYEGTLGFSRHWILTNVYGTLPYRFIFTPHSFGRSLSPVHLRHKSARSVSYYAFFQGWLLLGKPPGCLCTPTSFITERSFRGLSCIRVCLDLVPLSWPAPKQCFTPRCLVNYCTSTDFRENQLALGSSGISPLTTTYPLILQH